MSKRNRNRNHRTRERLQELKRNAVLQLEWNMRNALNERFGKPVEYQLEEDGALKMLQGEEVGIQVDVPQGGKLSPKFYVGTAWLQRDGQIRVNVEQKEVVRI